ncbi:energy-converting hydrogenase Eha subunit C [Microbacterium natoriense]|uniref:Energy-converting hydrogenase Eha subunit C n=1 Tax=Microbacterium natoriense TaxID=284570 RepID=A0AAW8EY68_9MICO|nr:DUF6264 family protein [Microbacterium natoriense]MDQ0647624.1 energy-converting hydrogenase Eha subunit C [Microbacterium natoriense]
MSDQRPQYGELATPEEQRRAAGLPPLSEVAPAAPEPIAAAAAPASARPHPVDRFATIALLAYGLVNVVMTGMSYLDLPTVLNEVMKILGIEGEFTDYAAGRLWGTVAAVVLAVGWTATAVLSVRRLRRGRITWWLPIVGAVVTSFLAGICVMVAMMGDPAFADYIVKAGS